MVMLLAFSSFNFFGGNIIINAGNAVMLRRYTKNKPMAITVPKTCRNEREENRNERNPTMSVKIAMTRAMEVSTVPRRTAICRAS